MKKLLLSLVIMLTISACTKESSVAENKDSDSISEKDSVAYNEPTIPFRKIEFSPEETTTFLGKKNDDTLYVTNFFATWCRPCLIEIPHFKQEMENMKSQPVKFTFISLDNKEDWDGAVKNFAEEQNLSNHIVLLDGTKLSPAFFPANFKDWDGGAIPFTFMRKGDQTDETLGSMSAEMLSEKLNNFGKVDQTKFKNENDTGNQTKDASQKK